MEPGRFVGIGIEFTPEVGEVTEQDAILSGDDLARRRFAKVAGDCSIDAGCLRQPFGAAAIRQIQVEPYPAGFMLESFRDTSIGERHAGAARLKYKGADKARDAGVEFSCLRERFDCGTGSIERHDHLRLWRLHDSLMTNESANLLRSRSLF